jgi:hypothetical protein
MANTEPMTDSDYDDEDFDLDYDEAALSPQMRAQMDRLMMTNRGFGLGGRSRAGRHGPVRRRIEDWHDNRAIDRSFDYLNDRLDLE